VVRTFQPDARTLVVRWRMEWTARPLGWSLLAAPAAAAPPLRTEPSSADEEAVSVSVVRLAEQLASAEASLVRAVAALEDAAAPPAVGAALADALRDLREGAAQSQALAAEVAAAEAADAAEEAAAAGWLGALLAPPAGDAASPGGAFAAEMAALREELTSRVEGSSTFVLDAGGRVVSHTDALEFDKAMAGVTLAQQLEEKADALTRAARSGGGDAGASRAAASAVSAALAAEESAVRASANTADAIFQLCLCMRLPERGAWGWRLDVLRQLLWEAFLRDPDMDDEVRLSLSRDDFVELVNTLVAGSASVAVAATSYLSFWAVFVAPQLPSQLAAAAGVLPGTTLSAPAFDWLATLSQLSQSLQPSLFR
jgi:hypothetical protein